MSLLDRLRTPKVKAKTLSPADCQAIAAAVAAQRETFEVLGARWARGELTANEAAARVDAIDPRFRPALRDLFEQAQPMLPALLGTLKEFFAADPHVWTCRHVAHEAAAPVWLMGEFDDGDEEIALCEACRQQPPPAEQLMTICAAHLARPEERKKPN